MHQHSTHPRTREQYTFPLAASIFSVGIFWVRLYFTCARQLKHVVHTARNKPKGEFSGQWAFHLSIVWMWQNFDEQPSSVHIWVTQQDKDNRGCVGQCSLTGLWPRPSASATWSMDPAALRWALLAGMATMAGICRPVPEGRLILACSIFPTPTHWNCCHYRHPDSHRDVDTHVFGQRTNSSP